MTAPTDPSERLDHLAEEYAERARRGEAPSIEEYALAHPDLAEEIRDLFPLLAVVEGLKDAPRAGADTLPETRDPAGVAGPVPERIGAYRILRPIGKGGMGVVYEGVPAEGDAEDASPSRVAVKVVHPHLLQEASYVARFLHEAAAGRRIEHPNVVRTLSTGMAEWRGDELPYLVLEYVEGQNLRALLGEVDVVPERLCRHIAHRLADALTAVHAAGLVHRDVKPENVVITLDETVKLMDLGVAVLQDSAERLSRTGEFVGSLLYAAPEQLAGGEPDPRWDLYSLGVLSYELATGRHPARALGSRWLDRSAPVRRTASLLEAGAHVSPFFDAVVRSLLAPDADSRFDSAADLRAVLEEGERSPWWRDRRAESTPSATLLRDLERPTRLVGRDAEWQTLDGLLAEAGAGEGRVVVLVGDAGMGKTRFLHEWIAATVEESDAPRVAVVPHGPGAVGGDEGALASSLLELVGTHDLEGRLAELLGSRAPLAGPLARHLRGSEPADDEGPSLDPMSLDVAYVELFRALAEPSGLILALEDLHFASAEALERFRLFARAFRRRPILLVGTTRPLPASTWIADLERQARVTRLDLEGLDVASCRALVREAARDCVHIDEGVAGLAERTDRNPFLLLEFVRDCMRRQPDTGGELPADMEIPASVRDFITVRLAALEAPDRELLEAAACCGYEFDPVVVAVATGAGRIAALKRFGCLERHYGMLRSASRHYVFQHHLVQEVLYAEIHEALRESYHAALGDALEREVQAAPEGPRVVGLSNHFLAGGDPYRARPYLARAITHLRMERHDYTGSAELAERALAVPDLLRGEDRAFALMVRGNAQILRTQYDGMEPTLEEALALAREARASKLEVDILMVRAALYNGLERSDEMRRAYLSAAEGARALHDGGREAAALGELGLQLADEGKIDQAEQCFRDGFAALRAHPDAYREGRLTINLARIEVHRGNLEAGEPLVRRALKLAHSSGDLTTEARGLLTLGQLAFRRAKFAEALDYGGRSLELGRRLGLGAGEVGTLANLAYCLLTLGRLDEALERANEAVELASRGADRLFLVQAQARRGRIWSDRGELRLAVAELSESFATARELGRPDMVLVTAEAYVRVLGLLGRLADARRILDEASELLGPKTATGRVIAARAELLEYEGRHEEACEAYREARSLLRPGRSPYVGLGLNLGRTLVRLGRLEDAREPLREAWAWGKDSGAVQYVVLPEAHLARLPGGDLLTAKVALETRENALPVDGRIEAHAAIWEASGDADALDAAWRHLRALRESAPPEDRDAMVSNVYLHRRIAEASDGHP